MPPKPPRTTAGLLAGAAEAPPAEPAAAFTAAAIPIQMAPWESLFPSPLNPRKRFDPQKLAELADNVDKEGVLLPLLVRWHADGAPKRWIVAGERRWRAVRLLIERGLLPADTPLPIRPVDPCDDRRHLELALTENTARNDMTPLEEAAAFAALEKMGASPADIAKTAGLNKRTIQKRLRLVRDLVPEVQAALEDGSLSVEFANVLAAYCPAGQQRQTLERLRDNHYRTSADLKSSLLRTHAPESRAFFDASRYPGNWIIDDDGSRYFADFAAFEQLQEEAIAARLAELKDSSVPVRVIRQDKGQPFYDWQWTAAPRDPYSTTLLVVSTRGVDVKYGMVHESQQRKPAASDGEQAAEPYTKAHLIHARRRKTVALQDALARSPMMALRMACLALIGGTAACRLRITEPDNDDRSISSTLAAALQESLQPLAAVLSRKEGFAISTAVRALYGMDQAIVWQALVAMPDGAVQRLHAQLIALLCGSFNNFQPELGDYGVVVTVAQTLGLTGLEETHGLAIQPEDLDGLRKPALQAIARQTVPEDDIADLSVGALRQHLARVVPRDYVVPSLRFGTRKEIEQEWKGRRRRQIDLETAIAQKAKDHGQL